MDKINNKTIFLDPEDYFLNLGNIQNILKKKSKINEVFKLLPEKYMLQDMQKAFDILDYKETGLISLRDIKVTLRALGIEPTATKIRKLAERSSTDGKCKHSLYRELSREEFENMFQHVLNDIDSDEQMTTAFRAIDADGKNYIDFNDLKNIAEHLHLDVANEEIQEMIAFAVDNDVSKVTMEQFIDTARKIF